MREWHVDASVNDVATAEKGGSCRRAHGLNMILQRQVQSSRVHVGLLAHVGQLYACLGYCVDVRGGYLRAAVQRYVVPTHYPQRLELNSISSSCCSFALLSSATMKMMLGFWLSAAARPHSNNVRQGQTITEFGTQSPPSPSLVIDP